MKTAIGNLGLPAVLPQAMSAGQYIRTGDTMESESIFNSGGAYNLVVRKNVMLHHEAGQALTQVLKNWSQRCGSVNRPLNVLDLACGGSPVTISALMLALPNRSFIYTGIDINEDQVRHAKDNWCYPANVVQIDILKGNAWTPATLGLRQKFDVVFSGLNFHHAVPEELAHLICALRPLCTEQAIVLSHDIYRPDVFAFIRRPHIHPTDSSESLELIPGLPMQQDNQLDSTPLGSGNWRNEFLQRYEKHLVDLGAPSEDARAILKHVSERDFPLSGKEVVQIFSEAGFCPHFQDFSDTDHPLGQYLGVLWAT